MRLNLSLLREDHHFAAGTTGTAGRASNDAALTVPAGAENSRDKPGQGQKATHSCPVIPPDDQPGPSVDAVSGLMRMTLVPAVPAASRHNRDSQTQQRRGFPVVPAVPVEKSNVGVFSVPVGVVGVLAANDCNAKASSETSSRTLATPTPTMPMVLVLTFELDGKQATCRDPVSTSLAEAVADLRGQFPERVGRIWQQGIEVTA